jgi:FkbM family methyltransferase
MGLSNSIGRLAPEALRVALDPRALHALATWPKFSLTSYRMMRGMAKQGLKPATIIDVGANIGQFAVAATRMFPEASVHSFEPDSRSLEKLRRNVAGRNVTVYPVAVGAVDGELSLHVNSHSHSSSLLSLSANHTAAFPDARELGAIPVQVKALDGALSGVELKGPVLLKLDVQGFESEALKGATELLRNRIQHVLIEVSFKPMYEGEVTFRGILDLLESRGFAFVRPLGWLQDPVTDEIVQMDGLFERR